MKTCIEMRIVREKKRWFRWNNSSIIVLRKLTNLLTVICSFVKITNVHFLGGMS